MPDDLKNYNELTLAIHSTDNSFGFAYRENNSSLSGKFFTKKLSDRSWLLSLYAKPKELSVLWIAKVNWLDFFFKS